MTDFAYPLGKPYPVVADGGFYASRSWGQHAASDYPTMPVPCYASRAGKVVYASWAGNAGNMVEVAGDGWKCRYVHLSQILVSVGDMVTQGQEVGVTGNTTNIPGGVGYHLHFAVWASTEALAKTIQPDPYPSQGWFAIDPEKVLHEEDDMALSAKAQEVLERMCAPYKDSSGRDWPSRLDFLMAHTEAFDINRIVWLANKA